MFYKSNNLLSVPRLSTINGTNFSYMFYGCSKLKSVPSLDTGNATNLSNLFYQCYDLETYPYTIDCSKCTSLSGAFANNIRLRRDNCPQITNTSKVTDWSQAFLQANALAILPEIDTSAGTNFNRAFGISSLITIPKLNLSKATNTNRIFYGANGLKNITFEGTINTSFAPNESCTATFSKATVESMINALSSTVTGKTLTLRTANKTSNFTDEEWEALIATKSNWTFSLV